jgi:hypothetical protein
VVLLPQGPLPKNFSYIIGNSTSQFKAVVRRILILFSGNRNGVGYWVQGVLETNVRYLFGATPLSQTSFAPLLSVHALRACRLSIWEACRGIRYIGGLYRGLTSPGTI